jgi:hypothetical protein
MRGRSQTTSDPVCSPLNIGRHIPSIQFARRSDVMIRKKKMSLWLRPVPCCRHIPFFCTVHATQRTTMRSIFMWCTTSCVWSVEPLSTTKTSAGKSDGTSSSPMVSSVQRRSFPRLRVQMIILISGLTLDFMSRQRW